MKVVKFKEAKTTFVKEGCKDLPAFYDGNQVISCWELSFKEKLSLLFKKKYIWLHIQGHSQPPVYLDIENPFKNDA